jgi:hypothetical protein
MPDFTLPPNFLINRNGDNNYMLQLDEIRSQLPEIQESLAEVGGYL